MPTVEEIRRKIDTDPDFVNLKRFDFSINKLLERYPDGAPVKLIAQGLMTTEEEVEETFRQIVAKLQAQLGT